MQTMLIYEIMAFVFLIPGIAVVFLARYIAAKYGIDKKIACEHESEMSEEEIALYKLNKAVVNIKLLGLLIALPGFILILIAFSR